MGVMIMEKNIINLENYSIYFDGTNIHFGTLSHVDTHLWLFTNLDKTCGTYLVEEEINADFKKNKKAVMVLKDAIIGNAYGADRNRGKENAGLDEKENEYINRLYRLTEFNEGELKMHEVVLSEKIRTRMLHADYEQAFYVSSAKLYSSQNPIDRDWHEVVSGGYERAKGSIAIANKNFNKALEELTHNMTESEAQ